jgi:chemotaxis protein methyltransferase CheR
MWQPRDRPLFNAGVAVLLRDMIHERTGLYFENDRLALLGDKLAPLMEERQLSSYLDYYYLLKDDANQVECRRLMDALSVPETYFWREMDQIRAVVHEVIPRWVDRLDGRPLRIWSVPCATGEEALTLAMVLEDAGWFARAPIEIHASDASEAALARARAGVYRERAFRVLPDRQRERHFTRTEGGWRIDSAVHARVTWSRVNLVASAEAGTFATSPIVFCRNLFIYFSEASIRRVVDLLARCMPTAGYLCLGVSESIMKLTNAFELESLRGAFVYVKR